MKKTILISIIVVVSLVLAFFTGMKWNEFQYNDICLDMGGGKNPGNHPICTVDNTIQVSTHLNNLDWVETIGTITESVEMSDGTYAYTLQYDVVGGDVKNIDGDLIQGPLPQHIFNVGQLAIKGQQIKLRYEKEEPMFYELLEDIKFIK
jgi:hypothetical protein